LYEGNGKQLLVSDVDGELILKFKSKVMRNNDQTHCAITSFIFTHLHNAGINTHFIYREGPTAMRVKRAFTIPIKIMVRNAVTGSICKRLGVQDGNILPRPLIELYYRSESLRNPMINEEHADILGLVSAKNLADMRKIALEVNRIMLSLFDSVGVQLMDFTLAFGKGGAGFLLRNDIVDSYHLWDVKNNIAFNCLSEANLEIAKRLDISI